MNFARASSMRRLVTIALLTILGCASSREPVSLELRRLESKTPVIFVPGITGTILRDGATGDVLWGNFATLLRPPEGGHAIGLPLSDDPQGRQVVTGGPVQWIDYLIGRKSIYDTVIRLMKRNGYVYGRLDVPEAADSFFFFAYDWRRSNVESARELVRQLERLRETRADRLEVDLICQSNATHICRWALKYGDVSLDEAERGARRPPRGVRFRKLIFIGTSHGGSIRVLREMNRGRRYVPLIGRRWPPEMLFTFPSFYQDLPVYRRDLFFDREGNFLTIDLFDAENWVRYGWSVFGPRVSRRIAGMAIYGSPETRLNRLREALGNARRFHALLDHDLPIESRYYSIQNLYTPTPDRALLHEEEGEWELFFTGDPAIERNELWSALAGAPGDGHATVHSHRWLTPSELAALTDPPDYFEGGHFEIVTRPPVQRRLLEILLE